MHKKWYGVYGLIWRYNVKSVLPSNIVNMNTIMYIYFEIWWKLVHKKDRTNTISLKGLVTLRELHKSIVNRCTDLWKQLTLCFSPLISRFFLKQITHHINSHVNTDSIWAMTNLITRWKYGASVKSPLIIKLTYSVEIILSHRCRVSSK